MKKLFISAAMLLIVVPLAACNSDANGVRISTQASTAAAVAKARSEPVFYNGKTYQLDFAPEGDGRFAMAVAGMTEKQEKDAVAVATSSLRYFACPEGRTGTLTRKPAFAAGTWKMQARCS